MKRKLLIFSGGDRVGKSTLVDEVADQLGRSNCLVYHHGTPPENQENLFDFYRDHVQEWMASDKEWGLFDRCYPCSVVLETFRRHNNGHLDDIYDLEIELMDCPFRTVHILVHKPWSWSAAHHVTEIRSLKPDIQPWQLRDEYVFRMKEHKLYYDRLREFFSNESAFPCVETDDIIPVDVQARKILSNLK